MKDEYDFSNAMRGRIQFSGYIEGEAEGAIPNGSRIRKNATEVADLHRIGATGTVLASHGPLAFKDNQGVERNCHGYFVVWDDIPGLPVFVAGYKIEKAE